MTYLIKKKYPSNFFSSLCTTASYLWGKHCFLVVPHPHKCFCAFRLTQLKFIVQACGLQSDCSLCSSVTKDADTRVLPCTNPHFRHLSCSCLNFCLCLFRFCTSVLFVCFKSNCEDFFPIESLAFYLIKVSFREQVISISVKFKVVIFFTVGSFWILVIYCPSKNCFKKIFKVFYNLRHLSLWFWLFSLYYEIHPPLHFMRLF